MSPTTETQAWHAPQPGETAVSLARTPVLATKLYRPQARPDRVARPRLMQQLD